MEEWPTIREFDSTRCRVVRPQRTYCHRFRTRRAARRHSSSESGKRVTLVESREVVGGACINTGTIRSKTLREAVLHLSGYKYQSIYGVNYRVKEKITMADLAFRVQHVIKTEIDVTNAQLSRNAIDLLTGTASFLDPRHVSKGSL